MHASINANIIKPCKESRIDIVKTTFYKKEFGFTYTTKDKKFGKKTLFIFRCQK